MGTKKEIIITITEEQRLKYNKRLREKYANDSVYREKIRARNKEYSQQSEVRAIANKRKTETHEKRYITDLKEYTIRRKVNNANAAAKNHGCNEKLKYNNIKTILVDPFVCYYCGKLLSWERVKQGSTRKVWEIDHVFPLSRGGSNTSDNIVAACCCCNRAKNDQTEEEFYEMVIQIYKHKEQLYKMNFVRYLIEDVRELLGLI